MADIKKKWKISIFSSFLFLFVTNKETYKLTNDVLKNSIGNTIYDDKITNIGYILHALIFLLLVRYSMDINLFGDEETVH